MTRNGCFICYIKERFGLFDRYVLELANRHQEARGLQIMPFRSRVKILEDFANSSQVYCPRPCSRGLSARTTSSIAAVAWCARLLQAAHDHRHACIGLKSLKAGLGGSVRSSTIQKGGRSLFRCPREWPSSSSSLNAEGGAPSAHEGTGKSTALTCEEVCS